MFLYTKATLEDTKDSDLFPKFGSTVIHHPIFPQHWEVDNSLTYGSLRPRGGQPPARRVKDLPNILLPAEPPVGSQVIRP